MRLQTIALLIGVVVFQQVTKIPSSIWLWGIAIVIPFMMVKNRLSYIAWGFGGFFLAFIHASYIASTVLPSELEGEDLLLEGVVASIPEQQSYSTRFEFEVIKALKSYGHEMPARVRLNWYKDVPNLEVGQRWQLRVRLKQPHGFMNPGGFDYEGWLFRHGIRATGYVRDSKDNQWVGEDEWRYAVHRWRVSLSHQIDEALEDSSHKGMVKALAIGLRDEISDEQWQVLTATGTNHLMAISGLHVGLVAGLAFFLLRWLCSRSVLLVEVWPAQKAAAVAAILAAFCYAALAGFSIPTQRALIMVAVFMAALIFQRHRRPSDSLALALLLVLMLDPLAVMDAGFWLSFAAVAFILYCMSGRLQQNGIWWRWGRVHLIIGIALLPLTVFLFQKASLVSPVANFIAVPWMSVLVVPLVMLGVLLLPLGFGVGAALLQLADWLIETVWPFLDYASQLPLAQIHLGFADDWVLVPAVIGIAWLLAPKGWPARWVGGIWLAVAVLIPYPRPDQGEAWFTLLDVGQGLAAVVQTTEHTLIFDTGPRFSSSFDTGDAVVTPFLYKLGVKQVDTLIVSHGDNDHIGGAESIIQTFPVKRLLTSAEEELSIYNPSACLKGDRWLWDGVEFEILHPDSERRWRGNDRSCVLKISTEGGTILLTGDVERKAERALIKWQADAIAADLLVVPHHGSKTSSIKPFVDAVDPKWALIPVGYRNRYHLPKADVISRYLEIGAEVMSSSDQGAMHVVLGKDGLTTPRSFRYTGQRYWTHLPKNQIMGINE